MHWYFQELNVGHQGNNDILGSDDSMEGIEYHCVYIVHAQANGGSPLLWVCDGCKKHYLECCVSNRYGCCLIFSSSSSCRKRQWSKGLSTFWAILLLLVSPLESVWSKWIQAEETENILEPISSQQGASVWSSKKKRFRQGKSSEILCLIKSSKNTLLQIQALKCYTCTEVSVSNVFKYYTAG